ncbi:hypothetical protein [Planctomicrobium sp. SH527]|uniref:hypothetical protein n=1 Tax=Planctomicrobium sp. SH527 TaxID=3448123 RepID=UPI003F5BC870
MNFSDHELPLLTVHVLGEQVFCSRAGVIASESSDEQGAEPDLGPKLHDWIDYDLFHFREELHRCWEKLCFWLTWLAPALLVVLIFWRLVSPFAAALVSLPAFYAAARAGEILVRIFSLLWAWQQYTRAPEMEIDLNPKKEIDINWWTLRKAGFDCIKPNDPHDHPDRPLRGKPWRMLIKTPHRIPVLCKHLGKRSWGQQHVVRLAAYAELIERCEVAKAPFGILKFGNSSRCRLIPITPEMKADVERELLNTWELLQVAQRERYTIAAPTGNQCRGCQHGYPHLLQKGSATVLKGEELAAYPAPPNQKKQYHSVCGDRFGWIPPHQRAVELGIVQPR